MIKSLKLAKQIQHIKVNSLWSEDAIQQPIWVNIGSGDGFLPDGTKPLPEPMLTVRMLASI